MLRSSLFGVALGVAFVLTSLLAAGAADPLPPPTMGEFTSVSVGVGAVPAGSAAVTAPSAPAAGALIYTDYVALEQQARALLDPNLAFRESISPYSSKPDFITLVQKFDYKAGLGKKLSTGESLQDRIDRADRELRQARDLYAFLAVYAPVDRFRKEADYITTVPAGKTEPLCGATNKEAPNPADPKNSGQVLPPVIDWCDFTARLRQSVREAANIRMIFAQQFVADALGLHFSGTDFKGGDVWVRDEVAKLRAAEFQYNLAQQGIAEALDRPLGSGCVVSDFFKQTEWSLMSEAAEAKETAQHHIAVRQSYLGDVEAKNTTEKDVAAGQAAANNTYRAATTEGHLKLIGLAGIGAGQPTGAGCAKGERPDGLLVAEMAMNMLKTREEARQLAEHRNVFGFDITLVPARPYSTAAGSADQGLLQEAYDLTESARLLQVNEVADTRIFDTTQEKLIDAVTGIRNGIDGEISSTFGCEKPSPAGVSDAEFFACAREQIAYLEACKAKVQAETETNKDSAFDTCMSDSAHKILGGDAERSLRDLRGVWLQEAAIKLKIDNIAKRIELSNDANTLVVSTIIGDGVIRTAFEVADALQNSEEVVTLAGAEGPITGAITKPGSYAAGAAAAAAEASSTAASVIMQESGNHVEVQNMLLDESEAYVDWHVAHQAFLAKESEFGGFLGDDLIVEAQRQRAYLQNSPANDPSYRITRDSSRLQLAKALEHAARISYLAARRAEYENAARLSVSGFRISDIYRARTAEDIKVFLDSLKSKVNSLAGAVADKDIRPKDYEISVAKDILGLSDAALAKEGFVTPPAAQAERTRRFRIWVGQNTIADPESAGKPALLFKFATNIQDGSIFANSYGPGFTRLYLQKMAGDGKPRLESSGLSANMLTDEDLTAPPDKKLKHRTMSVTQGGLVQLRAQSGCMLDYRLAAPAFLLGLEWSKGQDPEKAFATFQANVNGESTLTGEYRASEFMGRAISATEWELKLFSIAGDGLPPMNLQLLTDINLKFSTTYVSRDAAPPILSECVRIDF